MGGATLGRIEMFDRVGVQKGAYCYDWLWDLSTSFTKELYLIDALSLINGPDLYGTLNNADKLLVCAIDVVWGVIFCALIFIHFYRYKNEDSLGGFYLAGLST